MDLTEHFIAQVMTRLSIRYDKEQLMDVRNVITYCLEDYDIIAKKELPSNDVANNEYVLKHFLASKKLEGRTISTLKNYNYNIGKFLRDLNISVTDITTNNIRAYLAGIAMNNSKTHTDNVRRVLNIFFDFLVNEEYIIKNPCSRIAKIKNNKTMERPYTDMEIVLLREACNSPREIALVDFLLSTGARRDEVCKVKITDINMSERSVLLHGKGEKDRTVYFSARCQLHLQKYVDSRKKSSEYLFANEKYENRGLSHEILNKIVKDIGKRAGVNGVHLHRFRKWFGTYMANRGVPIQDLKEMMGHSNLDTTNSYYVYVNKERIKSSHKNNAV